MNWKFWRSAPAPLPPAAPAAPVTAIPAPAPREDAAQALRELGLGNAAEDARRFDAARAHYQRALELAPSLARVHLNLGNLSLAEGDTEAAAAAYRRALSLQPGHAGAWFNLGNVHHRRRELDAALDALQRALVLSPAYDDAELALALVLADLGRFEEALATYQGLLQRCPGFAGARANYAQLLGERRRYRAAIEQWDQLLAAEPDYPNAQGAACAMRAHVCDWEGLDERVLALERAAEAGRPVAIPFHLVFLGRSPRAQLQAGRCYAARFPLRGRAELPAPGARIRVAYLSANFHRHAVAALSARLFELHDRDRFEVSAWSFGPDDGSAMRRRLAAAFARFEDVRGLSDASIAEAIRAAGCDILVDLMGYTADARPGIFGARPAPVQVTWLGYPGTSGFAAFDYVIADRNVVPAMDFGNFSERVVWMPDSYQANDDCRAIAQVALTRKDVGLPETGFVWACFNNNFKIGAEVFSVWMRLLRQVPDSVLWLLSDNPEAEENLCRAAEVRGVHRQRLVFAPRLDMPEHLARHACADLFLDTLPYNAHTTASDALWAGLPVLTATGSTFAGRVAASLLHAAGLPELVCASLDEYERLALALAMDPARLAALRGRLGAANASLALFDSRRFARNLESAFAEMHRRCRSGLAPAHFAVGRDGAIDASMASA